MQAETYPTICTHHKLHNTNENKFPVFPECIYNKWQILGLTPSNYLHSKENQILVKIKLKRDTRLQNKNRAQLDFFATLVHGHQIMFTTGIQIFLR